MWHRIPPILRNKYFLTLIVFLVWLTFFDRNNFISQMEFGRTLNNQRVQKEFYKSEITKDSLSLIELSDTNKLEKFAREKYLFKKDNEDIYLIVKEDEKK
ncbi:MAG: septum formation inhibitor [Lentimicrobiaceae bacterium]